ncbi:MAG: class A beta-lactamase-related serine hydrolase [Clostridiales bacterium]|jgi:beta-lactamase class A|nr:class A beta-lactamase-related serine hydrolase [Eubacteriales bacterium]MDH7565885.1 class A beta-lactamase-related serine hydrolase [Clostridiales bacterium]
MEKVSKQDFQEKRKKKRKLIFKRIRLLFIVTAVVLLGWNVRSFFVPVADSLNKDLLLRMGVDGNKESFEASPPDEDTVARINPQDMEFLKKDLEEYIKKYNGKYGIYYYNLADGSEFGINHEEEYSAASTIKIPLNIYLYEKIKSGEVDPQETLTYLQEDYEEGTGTIRYEKVGKKYTLKELSRLSIVCSDNVAANMLFRYLGAYNIKQYMREMGGTVVKDDENVSCPKDMGLYMKKVYEFYQKEGALGEELMNYFLNTEYNDRIPALLPSDIKVAHKIGTQVRVFNDVGIIYADRPYILSIMTKEIDEDVAADAIANISKKVYDYVAVKN